MIIFLKAKYVGDDLQIVLGRDHIDMVALHTHSILRFHNGHRCILAQDIRQKALVIRRQMLDNDKRHSRISGKER